MTKDYSSAHIDGAEDLFGFIRDSNLDVNTEEERYVTNTVRKFLKVFLWVLCCKCSQRFILTSQKII